MPNFAVIVADPNSDTLGKIVSRHRTMEAACAALAKLKMPDWRWAYAAEREADGSWPLRCELPEGWHA